MVRRYYNISVKYTAEPYLYIVTHEQQMTRGNDC